MKVVVVLVQDELPGPEVVPVQFGSSASVDDWKHGTSTQFGMLGFGGQNNGAVQEHPVGQVLLVLIHFLDPGDQSKWQDAVRHGDRVVVVDVPDRVVVDVVREGNFRQLDGGQVSLHGPAVVVVEVVTVVVVVVGKAHPRKFEL